MVNVVIEEYGIRKSFINPLQAGYFLIGLGLEKEGFSKANAKQGLGKEKKISDYKKDIADMKNGNNISSLDEIRSIYS